MSKDKHSLENSYLEYSERHYGMDHNRYNWSMLSERKPVAWPNDSKLALWININVDFFPLNQQKNAVPVPGGMKMPYPDLRHFSLRDYGNRVGIYRIFSALDQFNIKPTIAINGAMVERAPYLMDFIKERGNEVIAHGWQMDQLHCGDILEQEENKRIQKTIAVLQERFAQPINGWLSPGRLQTARTPDLLAKNNIKYFCDWVNDELPYAFNTEFGAINAMPLSNELDDFFILGSNLHREQSYAEQVIDACDFLLTEAEQQGGRILALNIHPWMMGQAHRIGYLEEILKYLSNKTTIWNASANEILAEWSRQSLDNKNKVS